MLLQSRDVGGAKNCMQGYAHAHVHHPCVVLLRACGDRHAGHGTYVCTVSAVMSHHVLPFAAGPFQKTCCLSGRARAATPSTACKLATQISATTVTPREPGKIYC